MEVSILTAHCSPHTGRREAAAARECCHGSGCDWDCLGIRLWCSQLWRRRSRRRGRGMGGGVSWSLPGTTPPFTPSSPILVPLLSLSLCCSFDLLMPPHFLLWWDHHFIISLFLKKSIYLLLAFFFILLTLFLISLSWHVPESQMVEPRKGARERWEVSATFLLFLATACVLMHKNKISSYQNK